MFVAGAVGGFLSGLLGIGGGPIYVSIFTYFVTKLSGGSVSSTDYVKIVLAHTSFSTMFAALSGCIKQYRLNNFYWRTSVAIAIPSIIASILMAELLVNIRYNKTAFSIIFILSLLPALYRMLVDNPNKKRFNHPRSIKRLMLNITGITAGSVSALTGLGGGFVIVPMLNSLFNIKIRKTTSISLGVIAMTSAALALYYMLRFNFLEVQLPYMLGAISFPLLVPVLLGVAIFAPFGVSFAKRLTPLKIRLTFSAVCLLVIANIIRQMF